MTQKMIIDTDTASDDAVALMMALVNPDIDVVAITIVAGNVAAEQGSINARYTVQLCGKETPVYLGAKKPLLREAHRAEFFHGKDGMGNMNYPAPTRSEAEGHGVDALIQNIKANPGIVLVTLGPMTNVALAVSTAPEIVEEVSRCVVMGGAAHAVGNITPAAEYNIWCDPEAARICFRSGLPIEMVGWELCRGGANLDAEEMRYYKEDINTVLSNFVIDCNSSALSTNRDWLGDPGIGLPDPVAMAVAIDPEICSNKGSHHVEIECEGVFTRGMTVVDQLGVTPESDKNVEMWSAVREDGKPHVTVCWEIDISKWKALLEASVRAKV